MTVFDFHHSSLARQGGRAHSSRRGGANGLEDNAPFRAGEMSPKLADEEAGLEGEATMKASCASLAAAGLILAAGSAAFGATGGAAGLRAPVTAPPIVSIRRGDARRAERDRRDRRDVFGVVGPMGSEPPARQEEEAPQAAALCPPFAAAGRPAPVSSGPRIIEVGGRAPVARRGPLPVVVTGDSLR
jgi:hypothetical protein